MPPLASFALWAWGDKGVTNSMKAITLIAALTAMPAVTSGAFAAKQYMITSSNQVKQGAISLSDLSNHARAALHGKHGATGIAGPKGAVGATGAQGPKGDAGTTGAQGPK